MTFVEAWRRQKSAAFDLFGNSTAREVVTLDLWGRPTPVYANANLSIYSAEACNARCPFCVEELRPASRGTALAAQRRAERDDDAYFARLDAVRAAVAPLDPTVSITGGEPSRDPRLPRTLERLAGRRKLTMTTNGSGLLDRRGAGDVLDALIAAGARHLNVSRAHPDTGENERLMRFSGGLDAQRLTEVFARARAGGIRPRLSCVLVEDGVRDVDGVRRYLDFAERVGVDNVIFRQLMRTDARTTRMGPVVRWSDANRVALEPLLGALDAAPDFAFRKQVVGYYYYVEVWRRGEVDVVFEEADLARLETTKASMPGIVHELVFHPDGRLASTWQPWDGVLGPPGA